MNKKIFALLLALIMGTVLLAGCGSSEKKSETIKIGCMTSSQPIANIMKKGLEKDGYKVKVVLFDDNNGPCTALKDGEIDGVILNHKVWLQTFNKENGTDLVMAKPYIYYSPLRLYSAKYKSVNDFPNGATIAVPSDPANMDRSLRMLQAVKLIKLSGDKTNGFYTKANISSNPKNITLIEAEITTAANSINDADAVISPAQYIADEGTLDIDNYIYDDPESKTKYPLGLIVAKDDKDADWVKAGLDYMQTDEAINAFNKRYNGSYILYKDK